jgi:multidrug efflux pump subunit AcrB
MIGPLIVPGEDSLIRPRERRRNNERRRCESTAAAISGAAVGSLKEGNKTIPTVARLRGSERAQLGQIENLYAHSSQQNTRVPLLSVATVNIRDRKDSSSRTFPYHLGSVLSISGVLASKPCIGAVGTDSLKKAASGIPTRNRRRTGEAS